VDRSKYLAPPWWALLATPFGLVIGYGTVALPDELAEAGLAMTLIGTVTQVSGFPHNIKFLWSPVLDVGIPRRTWYLGSIVASAVSLGATVLIPPAGNLVLFTIAFTVANVTVATATGAMLALMATTLPDTKKGAASGWQTVGNLAGTSAGGALAAWAIRHLPRSGSALLLAAACVACAIPALFVVEPATERRPLGQQMRALAKDTWKTMISRSGWTGIVICLSPVGAGALTQGPLSQLVKDYTAVDAMREKLVVGVNGLAAGLVGAFGALAGGYLSDRMNARLAYVIFGGVTALTAIAMIAAPATPTAFTVGCLAYQFTNAVAFSAFYAFVLQLAGQGEGAATKIALFTCAGNLAITYVTFLDDVGYDVWAGRGSAGRYGMLGMDALASFVGIAMLGAMTVYLRRTRPSVAAS
jgi:MFS transporter, PAT family, beta-lactamase induction signal transducer AmpG